MIDIAELLAIDRKTQIVDIGDLPIGELPPYKPMLEAGLAHVIGFDAYHGEAIGNGEDAVLRLCKYPGFTSLLEPDAAMLEFAGEPFPRNATVIERQPVSTTRLDDLGIGWMDFLRMDVQGSELDILSHGRELLKQTAVVQTEVSFLCFYEKQAGFGEIDVELRAQGFVPHMFVDIKRVPLKTNQIVEADMVYMRDIVHPENIATDVLKQIALILHYCYSSFDVVWRVLRILDKRGAQNLAERYEGLIRETKAA